MQPFTIRKIDLKKEKAIADELVGELHESELNYNNKTAQWKDIRKKYLKFIKECIKENDGTFLVAEAEGKAIGFIFGYIDEKDESNFETGDGDDLYVSEGYVKKEYRKLGVYTALNKALEDSYKSFNLRRIYRYTLVNNTIMQSWLQKQGYTPVRLLYEKWLK